MSQPSKHQDGGNRSQVAGSKAADQAVAAPQTRRKGCQEPGKAPESPEERAARLRAMSVIRTARWQQRRIDRGLCSQCGEEPLSSTRYGQACLQLRKGWMQARRAAERGAGRQGLEK